MQQSHVTPEFLESQGLSPTFPRRFFAKIRFTDSCWIWTHSTTNGYGQIMKRKNGGGIPANRASWILHFGSIPEGMAVLHDCPGGDNRACVNPAHLWLGTRGDNLKDAANKWRDNHYHKIDPEEIEIIKLLQKRMNQTEIARVFGVTQSEISRIINGKRLWRALEILIHQNA